MDSLIYTDCIQVDPNNYYSANCALVNWTSMISWSNLEKMVALPWSKSTDKLDERRCVGVCETTIDINSDFVHTIHKLQVQRLKQLICYKLLQNIRLQHQLSVCQYNHCQSSVCCAILLLKFAQMSSFLCPRPDDMELTAETSAWSYSHYICFWTITWEIILCTVLMYAAQSGLFWRWCAI